MLEITLSSAFWQLDPTRSPTWSYKRFYKTKQRSSSEEMETIFADVDQFALWPFFALIVENREMWLTYDLKIRQ